MEHVGFQLAVISNDLILNWFTIYNGTYVEFPLAYSNQVFFVMITERNLGMASWDCMNVYSLSLTNGQFDSYGVNGQYLGSRARFVAVFGYQ